MEPFYFETTDLDSICCYKAIGGWYSLYVREQPRNKAVHFTLTKKELLNVAKGLRALALRRDNG